jgi:hypothetical protein
MTSEWRSHGATRSIVETGTFASQRRSSAAAGAVRGQRDARGGRGEKPVK